MAGNARTHGRSVISKIHLLLAAIAKGNPCTLTEMAARTGLPLSTVHRLSTELAAWRVLERAEDGRYRAGAVLHAVAEPCLSCATRVPRSMSQLRRYAAPVMEDLHRVIGLPVRVGYLDRSAVAYLEKRVAHQPVSDMSSAARLPAHATALGKVLLAYAPPRTSDAVLGGGLQQFTPNTVTDPDQLRQDFRVIRATGVGTCDRELDLHAGGVAMPVFGARGQIVVAMELTLCGLRRGVAACMPGLAVAASALSRELPTADALGATRHERAAGPWLAS